MKRSTALLFAVPLLLAGCSDTQDSSVPEPTTSSTAVTTEPPSGPVELSLGESAHLVEGANGPRDITVTVDEISVSNQCHEGLNNYSDGTHDGYYNDHGYFIKVTGEFEVIKDQTNYSVSAWDGTTADGYAVNFEPASECNRPEQSMPGYQTFSDPIDAGQKARAVEEYWVSELPEILIVDGPYEPVSYSWPVPQEVSNEAAPSVPVQESSTDTASSVENDEDVYIVECLFGTPGPSLMSDGSVQNTEFCGNQPGAEDYRRAEEAAGLVEDPSNIPYADGGTCAAAICGYGHDENGNRNPSSGEIQTRHGCQEGYITDAELCAAVEEVFNQ